MTKSQNLSLDLQFATKLHQDVLTKARVQSWVRHALAPGVQTGELSVRIVARAEGQALNLQFRNKDYATNVLTFDYSPAPHLAADIVICAPVVAQEAKEQGKSLLEHYAHLVVHGVLHAQGYDHEINTRDADEMEALEMLLLLSLNFDNPYAE